MKTFDKKDVFTCVNAEDAKAYIGGLGYFANTLNGFKNIQYFAPYSLDDIQVDRDKPFFYRKDSFALFLPADKVKEVKEEKQYRPFKNFAEFKNVTNKDVGDLINYKLKNSPDFYCAVITKTFCSLNIEPTIDFGNSCFKYTELFNNFLWLDSENTWKPFGVEVEE